MFRIKPTLRTPLAGVLLLTASAFAQQLQIGGRNYRVISFDVPGAVTVQAPRISNTGQIAGFYTDSSNHTLGYYKFLTGPVVNGLKDPNDTGNFTRAAAVNDEGVIAGGYFGPSSFHGFSLKNGQYTTIDVPGATNALINGLNNIGMYSGQATNPSTSLSEAFLVAFGNVTFVTYLNQSTFGQNVNNLGIMIGNSFDSQGNASSFARLWSGALQPIAFPNAVSTSAVSINDLGEIVGSYKDTGGHTHGFLFDPLHQHYYSFDLPLPGVVQTLPGGLNDFGVITGHYVTAAGAQHGFILEPVSSGDDDSEKDSH
jgi:uncharacterized membrane protein